MTTTQPVALVTGASSGIGKAAALALVEAGFEVVGTSRNTWRVTPPHGVTFLDLDVASDESATAVVQQVIERFGRIDVLVNNAGIGSAGAAEEKLRRPGPAAVQHQRLRRHPHDQGRPAAHARPGTRTHHQHLVRPRVRPQPYMAAYAASKHAVEGYSESLDHEVREHGVRVLLVEPAYTNTGFDANSVPADTPLPVYAQRGASSTR